MSERGRSGGGAFIGTAALLLATAAALVASATAGEPGHRATVTADEPPTRASIAAAARRLTPDVARRVERIRGLEFEQVPEPRVISAERFAEISAREAASRPRTAEKVAEDEVAARLLGLMTPDEQLDVVAEGAPNLAAAAWDTRTERLYVIADASGDDPALLEFLLAHELDHALEDQRFGLPEVNGAGDDDVLASLALIEGSATAVMTEYASRHLSPLGLAAASIGLDPGTEDVPRFYVDALTWAYLRGAAFVDALRAAGQDWARVDAAFERPPASTEQVLHPRAYLRREPPVDVSVDVSSLTERGWSVIDRGELGEFMTAQLLEVGAPPEVAKAAAGRWGGDAYVLLAEPGTAGGECERDCQRGHALVAEWRWDSPAEAREFARALPAYLIGGLGGRPRGGETWALDRGWAAVATSGESVRLAFAPTPALARRAANP